MQLTTIISRLILLLNGVIVPIYPTEIAENIYDYGYGDYNDYFDSADYNNEYYFDRKAQLPIPECLTEEAVCIMKYVGALKGVLSNTDSEDAAILLVQNLQKLPAQMIRPVKLEICGKWSKVFQPISDYCTYTEVIKEKQDSFVKNTIDNFIRGNEVIIATTFGNLAATAISYVSSMNTITTQRAELDRMSARVDKLSSNFASNGRSFKKFQDTIQRAKDFISKKQSDYIFNHKVTELKRERIASSCDSNLVKRILKKQTPVVTNFDRLTLLSTIISLSVSALALITTFSKIEVLKRDTNELSKALAGLATTSGRSFPNLFEGRISNETQLLSKITPALKQFSKRRQFLSPKEKASQGVSSTIKTYFQKLPSPCFLSPNFQQIDRQGAAGAIGSIIGGMANFAVTGVGAAASASSLADTANGITDLETAFEAAEARIASANAGPVCAPLVSTPTGCEFDGAVNNDYCDDGNNTPECQYDGGDCCDPVKVALAMDGGMCTICECLDCNDSRFTG